jgi:hypothetical protein
MIPARRRKNGVFGSLRYKGSTLMWVQWDAAENSDESKVKVMVGESQ